MGILRYIVQGIGWELGSQAARSGIDALKEQHDEPLPSPREQKRLAKAAAKEAARARKERALELARQQGRIDAELAALKKKAKR